MKSTADELMRQGFARMAELERRATIRPMLTRSRYMDSIALNQLPTKSATTLVDTDGVFWFIPGLSIVGDGDKVRP